MIALNRRNSEKAFWAAPATRDTWRGFSFLRRKDGLAARRIGGLAEWIFPPGEGSLSCQAWREIV